MLTGAVTTNDNNMIIKPISDYFEPNTETETFSKFNGYQQKIGNNMKINIGDWFDVNNTDHLKAWAHMEKTGFWPKDFIPTNINFTTNWHMLLMGRMASEYVNKTLAKSNIVSEGEACFEVKLTAMHSFQLMGFVLAHSEKEAIVKAVKMSTGYYEHEMTARRLEPHEWPRPA